MVKYINVADDPKKYIDIGRVGENEVTQVDFDFSDWIKEYGNGTAALLVRRYGDEYPYPVSLTINDNIASWLITDVEVSKTGKGAVQVTYYVGDKRKKSVIFGFICGNSIEGEGEAPDPYESWLETLMGFAAETEANAISAQGSANSARTSAQSASASEANAQQSAESASTNADSASSSATNASIHAQAAATSASEASAAYTSARASATTARNNATQAQEAATSASTSATNASASATAAANSASAAAASASAAEAAKEDVLEALDGYATEEWVEGQGYLTEHQDISGKADKSEIPTKVSDLQNDAGYLTEQAQSDWTETDNTSASYVQNKPSIKSGTGDGSVIEGCISGNNANTATSTFAHAEGVGTNANAQYCHTEGGGTTCNGAYAHAEGLLTSSNGVHSHSEGYGTIASSSSQHVQGKYNIEDSNDTYAHIVGNGTSSARSNAHTLDWSGNAWYAGKVTAEGTPTEDNDLVPKSYVDGKLLNAFPVDTASGSVASFSDGAALPLKSLVADINPVQNLHGYSSPWPAGGGKNLLDADTIYSQYKQTDGSYLATGTVTASNKIYIPESLVGVELTFSAYLCAPSGSTITNLKVISMVGETRTNGNNVNGNTYGRSSVTFTPTSTTDYVLITYGSSGSQNMQFKDIQLEKGSSATDFAPYENICPISGWTESNVWKGGKNLASITEYGATYNATAGVDLTGVGYVQDVEQSGNTIQIDIKNTWKGRTFASPVLKAGTYTVRFSCASSAIRATAYATDSNLVVKRLVRNIASAGTLSATATVEDGERIAISLCANAVGILTVTDLQIEYGSTASAFEEYNGTPIAIDFGQTVYGGVLDVLSGVLTITMGSTLDMSLWNWGYYSSGNYFYAIITDRFNNQGADTGIEICDRYKYYGNYTNNQLQNNMPDMNFGFTNASAQKYIYVKDSRFTNVNDFKASLVGAQMVYTMSPYYYIEIQLDPHEVSSLLGQNTIYADTGDASVEYRADPTLYIQKKIAEAISALS